MDAALELRGITKRFGRIVANDGVDFDLRAGEVHALLGENGAGKSTLMNVLYGLYHPDEGEIRVAGKPLTLGSPREAIRHGIGMVHQHFMLIPVMTVAENIVLAAEPTHAGVMLDLGEANERVREISARFGLAVHQDLALVRVVEPVQDVHQGGLARAVLAEQAVDLTRLDDQIDPVVGDQRSEPLGDSAQFQTHRQISLSVRKPAKPLRAQ